MRIGVVYPQTEFPTEAEAIVQYAQHAEQLGFTHILAYDHVVGAKPERPGGWRGPYTDKDSFMEPFVTFAYLAALTEKIEFTTGVLVLPQRQTALVAKQAAILDLLSKGRLRLGVGIGWNAVEFEALGETFTNRGRRVEEQIQLLQQLWTQKLVTADARWHKLSDVGLNPMPLQQPIPIWFGGHHENVLRRVAKYAQGWMPNYRQAADALASIKQLGAFLEKEQRSLDELGLEVRLQFGDGNAERWKQTLGEWQELGASHASINTMGAGLTSAQAHMEAIQRFAEAML